MHEERKQSLPPLEPASSLSRSRRRRTYLGRSIAVVLLGAALAAGYYYSRPIQEKYKNILAQWPSVQQSVSAMGARVNSLEENLRAWAPLSSLARRCSETG